MNVLKNFNSDDWYFCVGYRGYFMFSHRSINRYCITQWDDETRIHEPLAEYFLGEHSQAVKDFDDLTREPWL